MVSPTAAKSIKATAIICNGLPDILCSLIFVDLKVYSVLLLADAKGILRPHQLLFLPELPQLFVEGKPLACNSQGGNLYFQNRPANWGRTFNVDPMCIQ